MTREEALTLLHTGMFALADLQHIPDAMMYELVLEWVYRDTVRREEALEHAANLRRRLQKTACIHDVITNRSRALLVWILENYFV